MRVALLNNQSVVTGGADRHCFDLADELRKRGHEVAFLATGSPGIERRGAFVPLLVSNSTRDLLPRGKKMRIATRSIWNRSAHSAMNRLVDQFHPEIVHAHKLYPHLSVAPILVARDRGLPIVQTVHDYEFISASPIDHEGCSLDRDEEQIEYRALNTFLFAIKKREHIPSVSEWIAVSRSVADRHREHGIATTPIPNFTVRSKSRPGSCSDREGILYFGRLTESKGVRDVIEVARRLPETPVRIAGGGTLEREVRSAADEISNLTYLGTLPGNEVLAELGRSRVCIMPSRWQEPGPLASLEAMAAGTPLVAYGVGGLAEYIIDAGAGIVVDLGPDRLTDACMLLLSNDRMWQAMSDSAIEAVRSAHSPQSYCDSLLEVYDRAMRRI